MAAFCKVVLLIAGFGSCVQSATHNYRPLRYSIPRPLIQAFRPEGLKVSIPHTPGIQLFAFHANINKPLATTEKGLLARDVPEKDGDEWTYHNSTVKLDVGDKIYYRLYVVKDNLGYRFQNGIHEIKALDYATEPDITTTIPITTFHDDIAITGPPTDDKGPICNKIITDVTKRLYDSEEEVKKLEGDVLVLKDLVMKSSEMARTLALDGIVGMKDEELVLVVLAVVNDKLGLPFKVENVRRTKSGLVKFEVRSVEEKLEIVRAAKTRLKYSKFSLVY